MQLVALKRGYSIAFSRLFPLYSEGVNSLPMTERSTRPALEHVLGGASNGEPYAADGVHI